MIITNFEHIYYISLVFTSSYNYLLGMDKLFRALKGTHKSDLPAARLSLF